MKLTVLFKKCVFGTYNHIENSGDYFTEKIGDTLYIFFESSDGEDDWLNNLDFPVKPYKRMGHTIWFSHRGFSRVWKSAEPYIAPHINDGKLKKIITVGYSHGAALAVFCHEYIWYNRKDIRDNIEGYGFGCPRVFWGVKTKNLAKRWRNFTVIRNLDDIVTHVPPAFLGFSHVGNMLEIGKRGKYSGIDAHRAGNIITELEILGL